MKPAKPAWRFGLAAISGATVLLIGLLTLIEYAGGVSIGIDELFFSVVNPASPHPGRPAAEAAVALACTGAALLLLAHPAAETDGSGGKKVRAAHLLAAVPASFSYLSLAGYLFGIGGLYSFGPFDTVSLNTGIASGLTALAILFTAPDVGWRKLFARRPISLGLLEHLLPLSLTLPLLLEALVIWGIRIGVFHPLFGAALVALTSAGTSSALT